MRMQTYMHSRSYHCACVYMYIGCVYLNRSMVQTTLMYEYRFVYRHICSRYPAITHMKFPSLVDYGWMRFRQDTKP